MMKPIGNLFITNNLQQIYMNNKDVRTIGKINLNGVKGMYQDFKAFAIL
jgi:hypothetical protein